MMVVMAQNVSNTNYYNNNPERAKRQEKRVAENISQVLHTHTQKVITRAGSLPFDPACHPNFELSDLEKKEKIS